jgi:zinc D-Ala-D-Ala dipeptidase
VVGFRWTMAVLVLVAASTACSPAPPSTARDRAGAGSSTAGTSAGARNPASIPALPPTVSASRPRPAVSSRPPVAVRRVPPLSVKSQAAGLVDIRTIVADAIVDLRYATSNNFVGVRLYPKDARCLVHQSMAAGLATAAQQLRRQGDRLVFWDCYRPHAIQVHMFEVVPNPNWVARPGPFATSHEAARSVDVTLARATDAGNCPADQRVQGHCLLDMGTGFDDFTPRAWAFATNGVSLPAQANRSRLRTAMKAGGITVYSGEWWHFDGPGALVDRPLLDAPLN